MGVEGRGWGGKGGIIDMRNAWGREEKYMRDGKRRGWEREGGTHDMRGATTPLNVNAFSYPLASGPLPYQW
jgi:hypothetical protein